MEEKDHNAFSVTHRLNSTSGSKIVIAVIVLSVVAGLSSGYYLAGSQASGGVGIPLVDQKPKAASQDNKTFKDFAEGKLTKKPEAKNGRGEGTHLLIRDGAVPVALTSSVVDLSVYENKKVKVFGETQKSIHEGWFMDVGKVEEVK